MRRPRSRRALGGCLAALSIVAVACVQQAETRSAADAADAVIEAWNERDFETLGELLAPEAASQLEEDELDSWLERLLERGAITRFQVTRVAAVEEPPDAAVEAAGDSEEEATATAPYEITYNSQALDAPVSLQGELELVFDPEGSEWGALWDEQLMFPGIQGARSFKLRYRWPKRAAILDRDGRVLARGPAGTRRYPEGATAGTTVGHLSPLRREYLAEAAEGLRPGALVGASRLEAAL